MQITECFSGIQMTLLFSVCVCLCVGEGGVGGVQSHYFAQYPTDVSLAWRSVFMYSSMQTPGDKVTQWRDSYEYRSFKFALGALHGRPNRVKGLIERVQPTTIIWGPSVCSLQASQTRGRAAQAAPSYRPRSPGVSSLICFSINTLWSIKYSDICHWHRFPLWLNQATSARRYYIGCLLHYSSPSCQYVHL